MEALEERNGMQVFRLCSQLLAKNTSSDTGLEALSVDTLFDALIVLYDECNIQTLTYKDKYMTKFINKFRSTISELKKVRMNVSDFEMRELIEKGHFGHINIVKEKQTGNVYAMKTIQKSNCLRKQSLSFDKERDIMILSTSPWLTSLQYAFQDDFYLYLIMDFHIGGNLLGLLKRHGGKLSETNSVFYLSELVQAVHALHCMGYVHRDLKPQNIWLDSVGHLKLTDFGSAAKLTDNHVVKHEGVLTDITDYTAIEVLQYSEKSKVTYGCGCDYWSVGVIAYELVIGHTPFVSPTAAQVQYRIINYSRYLKILPDANLSDEYIDFILRLIQEQEKRLNYEQILNHGLFKSTDWTSLREQQPPYTPKVSSGNYLSNFNILNVSSSSSRTENITKRTHFSGRNLPFIGFTYNAIHKDKTGNFIKNPEEKINETNKTNLSESAKVKSKQVVQSEEDVMKLVDELKITCSNLETQLAHKTSEVESLEDLIHVEHRERKGEEEYVLQLVSAAKLKWEKRVMDLIDLYRVWSNCRCDELAELYKVNFNLASKLRIYENQVNEQQPDCTEFCELSRECKTFAEVQEEQSDLHSGVKITEPVKRDCNNLNRHSSTDVYVRLRDKITELENILEIYCETSSESLVYEKEPAKLNEDNIMLEENVEKRDISLLCTEVKDILLNLKNLLYNEKCNQETQKQKQHIATDLQSTLHESINVIKQVEDIETMPTGNKENENSSTCNEPQSVITIETQHDPALIRDKEAYKTFAKLTEKLYNAKYEEEHNRVLQISEQLNVVTTENSSTNYKLESEIKNNKALTKRLECLHEDNIKLQSIMDTSKQLADKYKTEVEIYKNKLNDMTKQNETLTEACQMLDQQLQFYEKAIEISNQREKQLENEILGLKFQLGTVLKEVENHLINLTSERENSLQLANCCRELREKLKFLEVEANSYKNEISEYADVVNQLCKEISAVKEERDILEASEGNLLRKNIALEEKLARMESDYSRQLTTIDKLRESNLTLKEEVLCLKGRDEELKLEVKKQSTEFKKTIENHKKHELVLEATINQYKKVVDLIQSDDKKKTKVFENYRNYKNLNYRPINRKVFLNNTKNQTQIDVNKMDVTRDPPHKTSEEKISPHLFVTKSCLVSVLCYACYLPLELNSDIFLCVQCKKSFHPKCKSNCLIPCIKPESGVTKIDKENSSALFSNDIKMEGWVKFQTCDTRDGWLQKYVRLEDTMLAIYDEQDGNNSSPILKIDLCPVDGFFTIKDEISANEVKDTDSSELPLIFRIDVVPQTTCWPAKSYFIKGDTESDKKTWLLALSDILLDNSEEIIYKTIMKLDQKLEINCIHELSKNTLLLGCEEGLYAKEEENSLLHILGLDCVDEIRVAKSENLVVMIGGKNRQLVQTSLVNLSSIVHCAPCTKPTLNYSIISEEEGFLLFEISNFEEHQYLCGATSTQLFLLKFHIRTNEFVLLRKLETAVPVSCILFKDYTLIIGADKFFKIDMKTLTTDEFLNTIDTDQIVRYYQKDSFLCDIILVNTYPCEYLLCFNEYGIFVDEFGQFSRNGYLKWSHLPVKFAYSSPYLYVSEFTAVEIILLMPYMEKKEEIWMDLDRKRIEFHKPRYLGQNTRGIYTNTSDEVVYISAKLHDDEIEDDSQV